MLNNGDFMPHMIGYVSNSKINYRNGPKCFPNFGTLSPNSQTLTRDVYTNDRYHGVCFPTVNNNSLCNR